MTPKNQQKQNVRKNQNLPVILAEVGVGFVGIFLAYLFLLAGVSFVFEKAVFSEPAPSGSVAGAETDYPDTYDDHRAYRCGGSCASGNLVPEDGSFETGIQNILDTITFSRRMPYEAYAPGSGNILSADPARGFVKPEITTERAVHGSRSLKMVNLHKDGFLFDLNWIRPAENGKHVFSVYAKAENLPQGVTQVLTNISIYDKDWNRVTDPGSDRWLSVGGWNRLQIATNDLTAGEFYRVMFRIGSRMIPNDNGTFYVDAFQFERAENQANPQAGPYEYPTTKQELFAYTSTDALGAVPKAGNLYFLENHEDIYGNIQIREETAIPAEGRRLKWWLYDSYGDSDDTDTALANGAQSVSHDPGGLQRASIDLSQTLESAIPEKTKGIMKLVAELWDSDELQMIDREFLIFGRLETSPYYGQDRPDSFFANHTGLTIRYLDWSNFMQRFYQGFEATRPIEEYLDIADRLGVKGSREFGLLSQQLIENQEEWNVLDPYFDDYVNGMNARHMPLLPVIGQRSNNAPADDQWQQFARTVAEHYGERITDYEVLNEPKPEHIPFEEYYGYLWRAEQEFHAVHPNGIVTGPSSSLDYFESLVDYDDGTHGRGYDLFTNFANHVYFRYSNGMRNIPEDGTGTQFDNVDDAFDTWQALVDAAAPGGQSDKTTINSEMGINQSRLYDDIPHVAANAWTGDFAYFYPHMSGSIFINRKIASDLIRHHYYQIAHHLDNAYHFGLFTTTILDSGLYGFFDHDNTPFIAASAYSQMTRLLEGAAYVRRIESSDLRSNNVLKDENRAFVFSAPDPDQPAQTRPVVAVFNWDQSQTGAFLQNIPLETSKLDIVDFEGNPIAVDSGQSFSLPIDMSPKYLVGRNGLTTEEMVLALDNTRPNAPFRPSGSVVNESIRLTWSVSAPYDVHQYAVYRRSFGSTDDGERIANLPLAETPIMEYFDVPGTGRWEYRVAAIEDGSLYEASSAWSAPVSHNLAPTILPIEDWDIHEDDLLSIVVTVIDTDPDDSIVITAENLPEGASFTDQGDRTAAVTWRPRLDQQGIYPDIRITARDPLAASGTATFVISVADGRSDCTPEWSCSAWSGCAESVRTRVCTDQNSCGTDVGKPQTAEQCDSTAPNMIRDLTPD